MGFTKGQTWCNVKYFPLLMEVVLAHITCKVGSLMDPCKSLFDTFAKAASVKFKPIYSRNWAEHPRLMSV